MENLDLWNRVQETDPNHTKKTTHGNKFTSINATYQIMNATREFGLYGTEWGISTIEYEFLNLNKEQILVLGKAEFKTPTGSFPISSTILMQSYSKKYDELQIDDEWAKKLETDITTKALSKLGFNADVFLGRYDDNKYINTLTEKYKPKQKKTKISAEQFQKGADQVANSTITIEQFETKIAKYELTEQQSKSLMLLKSSLV